MDEVQVVYIHGGNVFKKRTDFLDYLRMRKLSLEKPQKWNNDYLDQKLKELKISLIRPSMPCKDNADYEEWRLHFENLLKILNHNLILVGFSLGGNFLAKYLSENSVYKNIISTYLIAPPFEDAPTSKRTGGGFKITSQLPNIEKNAGDLKLLFSTDDDIVPSIHKKKYKRFLRNSEFIEYNNKNGHFIVSEFPELIEMIKYDAKEHTKMAKMNAPIKNQNL